MLSSILTTATTNLSSNSDNRRLAIGACAATVLILFATLQGESEQVLTLEQLPVRIVDLSPFDTCDAEPVIGKLAKDAPKPRPFWVSSYPSSGSGVVGAIVRGLTGYHGSHKSYYAKTKGMKKCFGGPTTVTCEQIHPIVGIGPSPEQQVQKFQPKILLSIRNPLTVTPASFQERAERYHKVEGQASLDSWRKYRDEWLEKTIVDGWLNVTTAWHDMAGYDGIGMYLPFEHLLDTTKGPALALRLAHTLRDAGFPVAADADIPCVWYRAVSKHLHNNPHPMYEYATDYVPAYTASQKKYMLQRLAQLGGKYPTDTALQAILDEYTTTIVDDRSNDKVWTNSTSN